MRMRLAAAALLASLQASPSSAAQPPRYTIDEAARAPAYGETMLDTPALADMPPESWQWVNGEIGVRNVSVATITPFLPPEGARTGTAVVVAPGGGFLGLAIDAEGYRVARWLADHGIAAFVLKYRTLPAPAAFDVYRREMIAVRTGSGPASFRPPERTPPRALEDGEAAIGWVRANAARWGVDPDRVGMMGFSAGAYTTLSVALAGAARPAFIAPIYGPLAPVAVPKGAPPMFVALASDDDLFWKGGVGLVESWWKAGVPVEFHLYQGGGHGFGLGHAGPTTTDWIEGFRRWLDANGLLKPRR
jgi:acetyl esterase/lipase